MGRPMCLPTSLCISRVDSLLNLQYLNAFYKVKFWFGKMSGIADSICYSVSKKQVSLYDSPIIWAENAELKGDSMLVYINDSVVDSTLIFGNSSAVMEVDSGKYYNQVSGKTILASMATTRGSISPKFCDQCFKKGK